MKLKSLFILLLFFYGSAASQSKEDLLVMKNIDKEVSLIESDKSIKTYSFPVKKGSQVIQYKYKKKENKIVSVSREWDEENGAYNDHYKDYFILKNGKRVYANQSIASTNKKDSDHVSGWSCQFWFRENKVFNMRSHGHGKTELDDWDYEKEMRENFEYMMKTVKTFDKNLASQK